VEPMLNSKIALLVPIILNRIWFIMQNLHLNFIYNIWKMILDNFGGAYTFFFQLLQPFLDLFRFIFGLIHFIGNRVIIAIDPLILLFKTIFELVKTIFSGLFSFPFAILKNVFVLIFDLIKAIFTIIQFSLNGPYLVLKDLFFLLQPIIVYPVTIISNFLFVVKNFCQLFFFGSYETIKLFFIGIYKSFMLIFEIFKLPLQLINSMRKVKETSDTINTGYKLKDLIQDLNIFIDPFRSLWFGFRKITDSIYNIYLTKIKHRDKTTRRILISLLVILSIILLVAIFYIVF
jgi:hypothetical protein